MSNDVNLDTFPSNRTEALAMLYTQNQDLKGKTPTDISKIYLNAYYEISPNIGKLSAEIRDNIKSNNNC